MNPVLGGNNIRHHLRTWSALSPHMPYPSDSKRLNLAVESMGLMRYSQSASCTYLNLAIHSRGEKGETEVPRCNSPAFSLYHFWMVRVRYVGIFSTEVVVHIQLLRASSEFCNKRPHLLDLAPSRRIVRSIYEHKSRGWKVLWQRGGGG